MTVIKRRPRRRPSTAQDVARLAGVSRSAVSRTFTEGASASSATRTKVLSAARKLQYRPNLFARSLKTRRSNILGLAVSTLDNQYYPEYVQRLSEAFGNAGYRLLLFVTHGMAGPDPVLDELLKYRLDALVLASSTLSSALAEECRDAGVPVVMFNNIDPESDVTSIACTNEQGGAEIARFLVAGGHRRFAYISGLEADSTSYEREKGFTKYLLDQGVKSPIHASGHFSFEGAVAAARDLLKAKARPDAIFCTNDIMALAALQVARFEFALQPGRDISIVGFDNAAVSGWPCFSLTTYAQPTAKLVARTVELIQLSLVQPFAPAIHERIPGELIVRGSARLPSHGLIQSADGAQIWRSSVLAI